MKTIALITGANKGLGLETARQLGLKGMCVLVGARDIAKGETAAKQLRSSEIDAHCIELDVTKLTSISAAAKQIENKYGRLDILVNNAGIMLPGRDGNPSTTSLDVMRETYETNVFGLLAVTQAMLPLLRKSPAGRIVNLGSILGSQAEHRDPNSTIYAMLAVAYNSAKAAVNMITANLAHELRETPIKVNAVHPGWVQTGMGGPNAPMSLADGAKSAVMAATIGPEGPTGGFYHLGVHMRW